MALLARCPRCKNTFEADQPGVTACPHCAAQVFVPGEGARPPPTGAEPALPADERPAPFDERATRGFFPALGRTIKMALVDPGALFDHLAPKPLGSAILYGVIVAGLGIAVDGILSSLVAPSSEDLQKYLDLARKLGVEVPPEALPSLEGWGSWSASQIVAAPIVALAIMVLIAAWTHLLLLAFAKPRHAFETTLRAVGYAATPVLLFAIPTCGSFIGAVWALGLTVYGVARAQNVGMGATTAAVLAPLLACCCGGAVVLVLGVGAFARMM